MIKQQTATDIFKNMVNHNTNVIISVLVEILHNLQLIVASQKAAHGTLSEERSRDRLKEQFKGTESGGTSSSGGKSQKGNKKGKKGFDIDGIISKIFSMLTLKIIAGIAGLIALIVFLVKNPEIRKKIVGILKKIGGYIWDGIKKAAVAVYNWMNSLGPKAKLILAIGIAILGLIYFGPWGLLLGGIFLIVALWKKWYPIIIGILILVIGLYFVLAVMHATGPWGVLIVLMIAAAAMIIAFIYKFWDKIWGGIKKFGMWIGKGLMFLITWPWLLLKWGFNKLCQFFPNLGKKLKSAIAWLLEKIPFGKKIAKALGLTNDGGKEPEEVTSDVNKVEIKKSEETTTTEKTTTVQPAPRPSPQPYTAPTPTPMASQQPYTSPSPVPMTSSQPTMSGPLQTETKRSESMSMQQSSASIEKTNTQKLEFDRKSNEERNNYLNRIIDVLGSIGSIFKESIKSLNVPNIDNSQISNASNYSKNETLTYSTVNDKNMLTDIKTTVSENTNAIERSTNQFKNKNNLSKNSIVETEKSSSISMPSVNTNIKAANESKNMIAQQKKEAIDEAKPMGITEMMKAVAGGMSIYFRDNKINLNSNTEQTNWLNAPEVDSLQKMDD